MTGLSGAHYKLRPAVAADNAAVESLLGESRLPTSGVAASIDQFIVAESNGGIVGVIGLERYGTFGLLRSAAVSDSWRGKGVGRDLVERLLSDARRANIEGVYLLTTTAEGYFPSFGFSRIDREAAPPDVKQSAEFRDLCPQSAVVMELKLQAASD